MIDPGEFVELRLLIIQLALQLQQQREEADRQYAAGYAAGRLSVLGDLSEPDADVERGAR